MALAVHPRQRYLLSYVNLVWIDQLRIERLDLILTLSIAKRSRVRAVSQMSSETELEHRFPIPEVQFATEAVLQRCQRVWLGGPEWFFPKTEELRQYCSTLRPSAVQQAPAHPGSWPSRLEYGMWGL